MLNVDIFKTVVKSTPLISIDLLIEKDNKFLLGIRKNRPAKGYFFSIGGRIRKNEAVKQAMARIARDELGIELKSTPQFIGVFEHFYNESVFNKISTHYVNLAYKYQVEAIDNLPTEQHSEYKWLNIDELMQDKQVHEYVKDYFRK